MNSLEGMERAQPPEDTFLKIQQTISNRKVKDRKQWMSIAATIALIICTNIYVVSDYFNGSSTTSETTSSYTPVVSNFNIYANEQ